MGPAAHLRKTLVLASQGHGHFVNRVVRRAFQRSLCAIQTSVFIEQTSTDSERSYGKWILAMVGGC